VSDESPAAVSIADALDALTPLIGRTPASNETEWAASLGRVGNAGIYVVDYAGRSEWERHPQGDEIVMVLEGSTTLFMLIDGTEVPHRLDAMELIVVPQAMWHRFDTPNRTQVMTVTPQPTDHSLDRPKPAG
jgi:quercetin dioxygenase-like cupin family protein